MISEDARKEKTMPNVTTEKHTLAVAAGSSMQLLVVWKISERIAFSSKPRRIQ